jgi:hypothetical protein
VEHGQTVTLTELAVVTPAKASTPTGAAPTLRGLREEVASAHAALLGLLLAAQRQPGLADWRVRALGEELTAMVDRAERVQAVLEDRP